MSLTETDRGSTRINVTPVVISVSNLKSMSVPDRILNSVMMSEDAYVELAGVFTSIAVGGSDERSLPVILELIPADGNIVRGVGDVEKPIVIIFSPTV